MRGTSGRAVPAIVGVSAVFVAIIVAVVVLPGREADNRQIYRAWYAGTSKGPVVVVEEQRYFGPVQSEDLRYSADAKTTTHWFSHRVADGAHLGSFERQKFELLGGARERIWACDEQHNPLLLFAESLEVAADRDAIVRAVSAAAGGDFETGSRCYVDTYTGRLAITGANGKRLWVSAELHAEERTSDVVTPHGWFCNLGRIEALIEPQAVRCLSPASAPATSLVLSKSSALAKDVGKTKLLSGISASRSGKSEVLWTKSLAELAGSDGAPFWLGAQAEEAGRVVILLRTGDRRVHVIDLDPTTGAVINSRLLFAESAPGPLGGDRQ